MAKQRKTRKPVDITGIKYNSLTAISFVEFKPEGKKRYKVAWWLFRCDCGNEIILRANAVKHGNTKCCGYGCEFGRTTRLPPTQYLKKTQRAWGKLKARCYNINDKAYDNYGGRGIKVCDRWLESFKNFHADMGEPVHKDMSIERIDVNGDYCPENCKWISKQEQINNKRNSIRVLYKEAEYCLGELCKKLGLKYMKIYHKLKQGEEICTLIPNTRLISL